MRLFSIFNFQFSIASLAALSLAGCAHSAIDNVLPHSANTPGCAVGVARNGQTIESRAYGMASLEFGVANTPETIFEAGSVSKQFTAGALVMLEQQGKLSLDDPVRKYIPELPEIASAVTIRHMLNHTSGLRDWGVVAGIGGWPRGTRMHTMQQVIDIVSRQRALNYPPGSEYSYNNSGYNLAAIVAERVSGKKLPQLTRELFFEPLHMTSSSWRDDYTRVFRGRATAYSKGDDGAYHVDMYPENIYGNCCLNTTVGDLLKWNEHLAQGGTFTQTMERAGVLTNGATIEYAHGLMVRQWHGTREVAHSGSTGGYRAYLARYPEKQLSVALLCNDGSVNPTVLARRVAEVYLGSAETPSPRARGEGRGEGLYRDESTDAVLRLFKKDGALRAGFGSNGAELEPIEENKYRIGDTQIVITNDALQLTNNGRTTTYRRVDAFTPSNDQLTEYAGDYVSDEAEVAYRIAADEKGLTVTLPSKPPIRLTPTYKDGFRTEDGDLIRFTRDNSGRVDGLDVKSSIDMLGGVARVERLHFTKR